MPGRCWIGRQPSRLFGQAGALSALTGEDTCLPGSEGVDGIWEIADEAVMPRIPVAILFAAVLSAS